MSAEPLVIEWSPSWVRVYDPSTQESCTGPSIDACVKSAHGRGAIVAVSQRSAFVRSVPVPALSRDETAKTLGFKLGSVLPVSGQEVAYGFRIGKDTDSKGNAAIVGAVRTETLRRIVKESESAGLRLVAVLPAAFGSWLAARAHGLGDCAVVHRNEQSLTIDVVAGRELRYSRTVPLPETQDEIDDEIDNAFCIAKLPNAPILACDSPGLKADVVEKRPAVEFLADRRTIDRLLFSVELPEVAEKRLRQTGQAAARRAVVALVAALAVVGFAVQKRVREQHDGDAQRSIGLTRLSKAKSGEREAEAKLKTIEASAAMLRFSMRPAQSFTDMISVLGADAPPGVWMTGLTLERGRSLLVRGTATNGRLVSRYLANLSKRSRFRDVRLAFANQAMIGRKPVVQFGISGHAVGNFGLDKLPETEAKR